MTQKETESEVSQEPQDPCWGRLQGGMIASGDFTEEVAVQMGKICRAHGPGKKKQPRQRSNRGYSSKGEIQELDKE